MWDAIPELAAGFASDPEVRVVVMRGEGDQAFVSGADISEFEQARSGPGAREYDARNARAFAALAELPMPLIAQIHGYCVGGGCAIALCADIRYSADDGVFAIPAARLGLGYSAEGLDVLVRAVGPAAAREVFFTARRFSAEEALAMRLVNRVLPKAALDDFVLETAEQICANAPLTLRSAKRSMSEYVRPPGERDHAAIESAIARCYESDDYAEGVAAFLGKRAPAFKGR